jgi:hypothetical protein
MALLEKGGEFFNRDVISSSDLFEALAAETFGIDSEQPKASQRNQILKSLGYMQLPKTLKIKGKPRRIWVKRFMTNDQVRDVFDEVPF